MRVRPPENDKAPGPAGEADARRLAGETDTWRLAGETETWRLAGETETWRLAGAIAHELRTPLATMGLHLEGLTRQIREQLGHQRTSTSTTTGAHPSTEIDEALARLRSELDRAHITIDLVLAAIHAGAIDTSDFSTMRLREQLDSTLRRYPFAPGMRARVRIHGCADFAFHGSAVLFELVLFNLLDNAFQAVVATTHCTPAIVLRTARRAGENQLLVSDNGIGVPPEALARIFDAHYTSKVHGTGLGLAFCKKVMRSFGGEIECVCTLGQATTFVLTFPRVPAHFVDCERVRSHHGR